VGAAVAQRITSKAVEPTNVIRWARESGQARSGIQEYVLIKVNEGKLSQNVRSEFHEGLSVTIPITWVTSVIYTS